MPEFPAYTRDELDQRARNVMRFLMRSWLQSDADTSDGSDYDIYARMLGAIAHGMQTHASTALRLIKPAQSFGAFLRQFAENAGIGQSITETTAQALAASGYAMILGTNSAPATQPAGFLQHSDGTRYLTNLVSLTAGTNSFRSGFRSGRKWLEQGWITGAPQTILAGQTFTHSASFELCAVRWVSGSQIQLWDNLSFEPAMHDLFTRTTGAVTAITCQRTGFVGNKDPKTPLAIESPGSSVFPAARVLTLTGGRDALQQGEIQSSLRELYGSRLGAMTLEEIRQLCLECPGLDMRDVFLLPGFFGANSYRAIAMGTDRAAFSAPDAVVLSAYAENNLPDGHTFSALGPSLVADDDAAARLVVKVSPENMPDYYVQGGNASLAVTTGCTTTRLVFPVNPTGTIRVGDRVTVWARHTSAPAHYYLVQRSVTAVSSTYIDVGEALPFPPASGNAYVGSSCPIGQAVIDAVLRFYDEQVPVFASNVSAVYPAPEVTATRDGMIKRVADVPGVLDVAISGDVMPTFPADYGSLSLGMWRLIFTV